MDITAAVTRGGGPFTIERVQLQLPRADEVLVRIVAAGVCHSDLVVRDYRVEPMVLGHEGAGVVEAVGSDVTAVQPGDHVVLSYLSCGACPKCRSGRPAYCDVMPLLNYSGGRADGSSALSQDGKRIDGHFFSQSCFATSVIANERNTVKVADDLPLELLGPLGCGVQTGAGAVLNVLRPQPGSSIVVFGTGAVGLSAVMAARLAGCTTIIGVDVHPDRLALARELGATDVVEASTESLATVLADRTNGGPDFTIDTTGDAGVLRTAVEVLAISGVCGYLGAPHQPGAEVSLDMHRVLAGRTLRGICEGDSVIHTFIPELIEHFRAGRLPIDRMVKFYALDEINEACAASQRGEVVKPILRMS